MSEPWWQSAVVYQLYPRSFQDANGDGIGDLDGITSRLDYFVDLGVDAIWISPIFPSPMADFGYDVSNYCDVDPRFGTLADLDALVAAAHERGLKVLLDFVPNHTSDKHPWFEESRRSRRSRLRDWYIWRDAAPDGGPPNNWISDFGGSAWKWDETTKQYYLHTFLEQQVDLDWRNHAVQRAMFEVLHFWFARGIDGFRIDVLWHLIKDAALRDNPPNPDYHPSQGEMHRVLQLRSTDQPEVHAIAAEMRRVADGWGDRLLIGEIYLPVEKLVRYYGVEGPEVHLPFNFQLIEAAWDARELATRIAAYEAALPPGAWPNWVLGNHDRPRIATRVGDPQARVAAMLLLTLRGTPTLYYGDELGMHDVEIPPDQVQDPRERREPGLGLGRDPVRTPMAWDATEGGGFTTGAPWLPLHDDHATRNVAVMTGDPGSILALHRALLALRRSHPALAVGDIALVESGPDVLAYERSGSGERLLVALNLGHEERVLALPEWARETRPLLSTLATLPAPIPLGDRVVLRPDEGIILGPR